MKILCLHGVGSSGAIFEKQLTNFRRELDPSFELVFVDGQCQSNRGPGISEYTAGPFFCHTSGFSPADVAQAVEHLQDVLEEQGPFDGIFGFSQGAALTLSYFYQQHVAGEPVAVKFACLFSTAMPLSPELDTAEEIVRELRDHDYDVKVKAGHGGTELSSGAREFVEILQQTVVDAALSDPQFPWTDLDVYRTGTVEEIPRMIYPSVMEEKIQVPTVHSWGKSDRDYMVKQAELGRSICDEAKSKEVLHSGTHDVPKKQAEIKAVLRKLDWVLSQI